MYIFKFFVISSFLSIVDEVTIINELKSDEHQHINGLITAKMNNKTQFAYGDSNNFLFNLAYILR